MAMPRNRIYGDDVREQAYAMYALGMAVSEIGRKLKAPESSVRRWLEYMPQSASEECVVMRTAKKEQFIEEAWALISKSLRLADKRITRALTHEAELDELIYAINGDDDMRQQVKGALISKVKTLEIQNVRELSTLIGTMYDKVALASGDSTINAKVEPLDVRITVID